MPARRRADVAEIAADGVGLVGVTLDEPFFVALRIGGDGERKIRIDETLEIVGHAVPVERPARQEVEQAALESPRLQVADVVQPDVPRGAVAAEHMRLPAALGMLLQDQHLAFADARQEARRRQPAHARPDHDRVPSLVHGPNSSWFGI